MKNKEFLDFMVHKEEVPQALKMSVQKDMSLSLRGRSIMGRFIFLQIIGAIFSIAICPQFGIGFMEGHGVAHFFRSFGNLACASFCGALFLSSGLMLAIAGMKGEEVWWVWKHHKFSLFVLPAALWGALMVVNKSMGLPAETIGYNLTWIAVAVMFQMIWMQIRSGIYLKRAFQH